MANSSNQPTNRGGASTRSEFGYAMKRAGNKAHTFFGNASNSILVIFGVILAILVFIPAFSVVRDTFVIRNPVRHTSLGYTTSYWYDTFAGSNSKQYFWSPLGHSLLVSLLSCVFSIVFGGTAAYLITRTNLKFKRFISLVFIFPYVMPQWTLAIFWQNLWVNTGLSIMPHMGEMQALFGWKAPMWFVYGAFPISLVLGIHYAPFAYILIGGVLRNMDSNLEEAATILNVPRWKNFLRVTIPMLKPAILSTILLVFSSAMASYTVANKLGNPVEYYVLATRMSYLLKSPDSDLYGIGNVITLVTILLSMVMMVINAVQTGDRKSYTTVSGKSGQITKQNLGKVGKWVISLIVLFIVIFFCIGPMLSFALESFLPNEGDFSSGLTTIWWTSKKNIGYGIYPGIFYCQDVWLSLWNSVKLSLVCSLCAGTFGLLIGYAYARKRKTWYGKFVSGLAFLPYLLPSLALSAIFYALAANLNAKGITFLMASPLLLGAILGVLKYIPFASRSSTNAMLQLSEQIEEAAQIQNINWGKRMTRIVFPIQKSAFLSGYLLPFISCMREYDLFAFIGTNDRFTLTRFMFTLSSNGYPAMEQAANLLLVVIILVFNFAVNKITGASLDKGIGG